MAFKFLGMTMTENSGVLVDEMGLIQYSNSCFRDSDLRRLRCRHEDI